MFEIINTVFHYLYTIKQGNPMEKVIGYPIDKKQPCLPSSTQQPVTNGSQAEQKNTKWAITISNNSPNFGSHEENYCDDGSFDLLQGCKQQ